MNNTSDLNFYTIFHLNLAFAFIDKASHKAIVARCYWPPLKLIQTHKIPLAIEAAVHTLENIHSVDPEWMNTFKELLDFHRCERIASGDSQIIRPLVPAEANLHKLRLGQKQVKEIPGISLALAYVNEKACYARLLDKYLESPYKRAIIEWDHPKDLDHGRPVSSLVSKDCALGATEGEFYSGTQNSAIKLCWNPEKPAVLPMTSSQQVNNNDLNRRCFSLIEADETIREGADLAHFSFTIGPITKHEVFSQ